MTEPTDPQPPGAPLEPAPTPPPVPAERPERRPLLPWLTGAGFLILAAALIWVWRNPAIPPPPTAEQTDALARQLGTLEARVSRLEQRPQPPSPDLGPLTARVTALEQRPAAQSPPAAPTPDIAPLAARVAALEQRQPPSLAPVEARLAGLEDRQRTLADLGHRLDADEARFAAGEKRAVRAAQVQLAAMALAAGQKLGEVAGAPAALARFANENPPTEASLRQSFPPAARQALAAAHPATDGEPLLTRLWAQAQDLVTIRQGDHVLIGDPAAGVLARARAALDAGDLATAAADVGTLQGAPAQAMAAWLAQARALLEARAALASWAASG